MTRKPFPNDLGERIFQHVSQDAWNLWVKEMTKYINEYRLTMLNPEHQKFLQAAAQHFFFADCPLPQPPAPPAGPTPMGDGQSTPAANQDPKIKFV